MKLGLMIGLVLLIILSGLAFYKFEMYLPTSTPIHKPLSAQDIQKLNETTPITSIEVFKGKRLLQLKHHDAVLRSYPMRLGFNPVGHKQFEGDGKTPEGTYSIDWRNPKSAFYKSLHISYPNTADSAYAKQQNQAAGGDVMIHGSFPKRIDSLPATASYMPRKDWTLGCIAVTNSDMDEIWQLVNDKTKIIIHP